MDTIAGGEAPERGVAQRIFNQRQLQRARRGQVVDREADPIHGDRTMLYHKLGEPVGQSKVDEERIALPTHAFDGRDAVDVALDKVSAQAIPYTKCALEVHTVPGAPITDRGATKRRHHRRYGEPAVA